MKTAVLALVLGLSLTAPAVACWSGPAPEIVFWLTPLCSQGLTWRPVAELTGRGLELVRDTAASTLAILACEPYPFCDGFRRATSSADPARP